MIDANRRIDLRRPVRLRRVRVGLPIQAQLRLRGNGALPQVDLRRMPEPDRSLRQPWTPSLESVPRDLPQVSGAARLKHPGAGKARTRRSACRGMGVAIRRALTGRIAAAPGKPRRLKSPRRRSGMVSPSLPPRWCAK